MRTNQPFSIERLLKSLSQQVEELKRFKPFTVPVTEVDPPSPVEGQAWYNSTTSQLKVHHGGVTKGVTLT